MRQLKAAREHLREVSNRARLSWAFVKDQPAYVPRHLQHSWLRLDLQEHRRRLKMWWQSTEPRYGRVKVRVMP